MVISCWFCRFLNKSLVCMVNTFFPCRSISTIFIKNEKHVIISAPTYSEPGLPSIGKVWIIPATRFNTDSSAEEIADLDAIATRVLKGKVRMGRFGWDVSGSNFNQSTIYQDLLISAPSEGMYFSRYHSSYV